MKKQKLNTSILISKGILDGTHAMQSFPEVVIAPNANEFEQMERADYLLKWLEKQIGTSDSENE
jgi:hypothetical protein